MLLSHPLTGGSARPRPGIVSDYVSSIEALVRCIERCHGHLVEQRTAFAERRRQAAYLNRNQTQMACLDVGGTRFHTQRAVLTGAGGGQHGGEEHFFGALMAGCFACEEDDNGYIFIDRDPTLFVPLLEYLRDGELWVPRDRRLALLREARYFGMKRLGGHMRRPTRQYLCTASSAVLAASFPILPASSPILPASSPILPASSPILPASSPIHPASSQVLPASSPVLPASSPLLPASSPVLPASSPVLPASCPDPQEWQHPSLQRRALEDSANNRGPVQVANDVAWAPVCHQKDR